MPEDPEDEVEDPEGAEPDLDELADDEDLLEDDLLEDDDDADDDITAEVDVPDDEVAAAPSSNGAVAPVAVDEDTDEEEDDDAEDEDVEASLDVILKERLVVADEEEDEDEATDTEDRTEPAVKVLPKQPDEFVCQSCFLVKHPSQLADAKRQLCADCV